MPENNINFQPMPKRFMVWDKISKQFRGDGKIFSWQEIACMLCPSPLDSEEEVQEREQRCELVQSTNLFAKDGKEIFEGSLLQTDKEGVGYVYMEDNGQWNVLFESSVHSLWDLLYAPSCKLVGHILSNPELLEEQ